MALLVCPCIDVIVFHFSDDSVFRFSDGVGHEGGGLVKRDTLILCHVGDYLPLAVEQVAYDLKVQVEPSGVRRWATLRARGSLSVGVWSYWH